jgi:hypothetical protein
MIMISSSKIPSNSNFGLFISAVFILISLYYYLQSKNSFAALNFIISISFFAISIFIPKILYPLNLIWYKFGLLLGKFISPLVLGIMFFFILTPVSLITRLFGRDELKIKKSYTQSYWIDRCPPGIPSDFFKNQY